MNCNWGSQRAVRMNVWVKDNTFCRPNWSHWFQISRCRNILSSSSSQKNNNPSKSLPFFPTEMLKQSFASHNANALCFSISNPKSSLLIPPKKPNRLTSCALNVGLQDVTEVIHNKVFSFLYSLSLLFLLGHWLIVTFALREGTHSCWALRGDWAALKALHFRGFLQEKTWL